MYIFAKTEVEETERRLNEAVALTLAKAIALPWAHIIVGYSCWAEAVAHRRALARCGITGVRGVTGACGVVVACCMTGVRDVTGVRGVTGVRNVAVVRGVAVACCMTGVCCMAGIHRVQRSR